MLYTKVKAAMEKNQYVVGRVQEMSFFTDFSFLHLHHICERKKNCTKNQFQLSKLGCQNRPFHSELKMGKILQ